jgi:very-short-patch-repair endonuclease
LTSSFLSSPFTGEGRERAKSFSFPQSFLKENPPAVLKYKRRITIPSKMGDYMLLEHSRNLRKNQTKAEGLVWKMLRAHRLNGFKFKRQQIIGPFIVDFVCLKKRLIIELDGGHHASQVLNDQSQQQWLESQGFRVLRFWNNQVLGELEAVLNTVLQALGEFNGND